MKSEIADFMAYGNQDQHPNIHFILNSYICNTRKQYGKTS